MHTSIEAVSLVYEGDKLVAIVKRDTVSKKSLVYMVKEAKVEDIINLMSAQKE